MNSNIRILIKNLIKSTSNIPIKNYFPFLENKMKIMDEGSLHSMILTSLSLLGYELGYSVINEKNIYNKINAKICRRKGKPIRPDCIWMDKNTGIPLVIFEFEQSYMIEKVENLVIMEDDLSGGLSTKQITKVFVLIYFEKNFSNPNYSKIEDIMKKNYLEVKIDNSLRKIKYPIKNIPLILMKLNYKKINDFYIRKVRINFDRLFWNKKCYDFKSVQNFS